MKFGEAIELAKQGKAVARSGWNGKSMWITYSPGAVVPAIQLWGDANKRYAEGRMGTVRILPYMTMRTAGGEILCGWLASQTDMLSEDWTEVEPT
jgi:hypothetical protein